MTDHLSIGFIGFGEAAFNIAKGLRAAGLSQIFAYDINTYAPGLGTRIQERAKESETRLVESPESLARSSDVLLSTVTANAALEAAEQTTPVLEARHFYADLNSVSPAMKKTIESVVAARGARFVEAAIMAPVIPQGHRVPMLLGGPHARQFLELLTPYGMRLEVVADTVGIASATKMCRSIIVKGLEALVLECLLAASSYGAEERVFASLEETFPGFNWTTRANYMVGRVVEHGVRRAREMEEVSESLRAIGIDPIMSEATAQRQEWGAQLNLPLHLGDEQPGSYYQSIRAIMRAG